MKSDFLRRFAAAAGLASATAVAGAQIPAEVTVPLGDAYPGCPQYGYGANGFGGGVVYDHHGGAYAAGYGYGQTPGRSPIERIPVQYLRYYPAVWYGLPGSTFPVVAPQVHMPTDTTQLGFYYQRVPTWAPVPGMVPPAPIPSAYHSYGYGAAAGANGEIVAGSETSGVSNGEVISVRTLSSGSKAPTHTPTGQTPFAPNTVPLPPGSNGASDLPLQPPPSAPAAEPSAFIPPSAPEPLPTIEPLFPAGGQSSE
jgi:hypothetical protein